jgi:hypothetical protein
MAVALGQMRAGGRLELRVRAGEILREPKRRIDMPPHRTTLSRGIAPGAARLPSDYTRRTP